VTAAIRVAGLGVQRGGRAVLRDLGFAVDRGTVTGLLGPSASGKTTLMRAVVGVQRHVAGEVEVLGRPAGDPSLRHRIGYVTQAPSVYADLTVGENMSYFATVLGAGEEMAATVLETVDLTAQADELVAALSGGQRSRVSLATALLGAPELLVLDEPTVGLDPVLRADLWDTFHRLADGGATLLVSSHVMDEADRCDRVLILRDGSLAVDDTPAGMRERSGRDRLEDAFLALVAGERA
jgi:ABC-2 type transport system ATP-binding protein